MVLYATSPARRLAQLAADAATIVVTVGSYLAGRAAHDAILALADPVSATAGALTGVQGRVSDAAATAGTIPGVGDVLRSPLDGVSTQLGAVIDQLGQQVAAVERVAGLTGLAVFLVPLLLWWAVWLRARVRFVREAGAGQRLLAEGAGLDLFALRGLAHLPLTSLTAADAQLARGLVAAEEALIASLAGRELDRLGVRPPG